MDMYKSIIGLEISQYSNMDPIKIAIFQVEPGGLLELQLLITLWGSVPLEIAVALKGGLYGITSP